MKSYKSAIICAAGVLLALVVGWAVLRFWDRHVGNVPMQMYGRVIDAQGAPLADVHITAAISRMRWTSHPLAPRMKGESLSLVTDQQGRFSIQISSGKFISLDAFEKPGWQLKNRGARMPTIFQYPLLGYEYPPGARKRPDNPSDPIVYTMVPVADTASGAAR